MYTVHPAVPKPDGVPAVLRTIGKSVSSGASQADAKGDAQVPFGRVFDPVFAGMLSSATFRDWSFPLMAMVILLAETAIQLVPDGTIVLHIVLILVMIGVLNRTLFQPINRVLAEREKKGSGALAEAEEIESQVRLGNKRYSDALRSARAAGYKLMEERRGEELREREVRLGSMKAEIESALLRERAVIQNESAEARAGLDSASLATQIRDQILKPAETGRN